MKEIEQQMGENRQTLLLLIAQVFMIKMLFLSHLAEWCVVLEQIHTRSAARCFSLSGSVKETPTHL